MLLLTCYVYHVVLRFAQRHGDVYKMLPQHFLKVVNPLLTPILLQIFVGLCKHYPASGPSAYLLDYRNKNSLLIQKLLIGFEDNFTHSSEARRIHCVHFIYKCILVDSSTAH